MRKAYLLVYDASSERESMKQILESMPEILNWRFELPNSFYLVSDMNADQIAELIRGKTSETVKFIVAEITLNKQGWLAKDSWRLINEKHLPGQ